MATRQTKEVSIPHGNLQLMADLTMPPDATGIVIFAHGSGSSRFSPRNRHVARILERAGMATLLLDLLTPGEEHLDERTLHYRFDIPLLAQRMITATDWVRGQGETRNLHIGYFGASTGAAAAIVAATHRPRLIQAVVSRGGRPDLAGASLTSLWAPTLLIVGGNDETVLAVNREAARKLCGPHDVQVVPGATHLFEEDGALDKVARMASVWFCHYLPAQPNQDLGAEWDRDEQEHGYEAHGYEEPAYEHILEGSIVRGEDRNA